MIMLIIINVLLFLNSHDVLTLMLAPISGAFLGTLVPLLFSNIFFGAIIAIALGLTMSLAVDLTVGLICGFWFIAGYVAMRMVQKHGI